MSDCKFKHTERTGLYLMVAALLIFGPCSMPEKADMQDISRRVSNIEDSLSCFKCHAGILTIEHPKGGRQ